MKHLSGTTPCAFARQDLLKLIGPWCLVTVLAATNVWLSPASPRTLSREQIVEIARAALPGLVESRYRSPLDESQPWKPESAEVSVNEYAVEYSWEAYNGAETGRSILRNEQLFGR